MAAEESLSLVSPYARSGNNPAGYLASSSNPSGFLASSGSVEGDVIRGATGGHVFLSGGERSGSTGFSFGEDDLPSRGLVLAEEGLPSGSTGRFLVVASSSLQ